MISFWLSDEPVVTYFQMFLVVSNRKIAKIIKIVNKNDITQDPNSDACNSLERK
ncbi:MAG: hypothetical protein IJG38_00355 [Thermoguttaceae bacterium]|nr:hypothetical protein [Thermoguttaceae bacterium]